MNIDGLTLKERQRFDFIKLSMGIQNDAKLLTGARSFMRKLAGHLFVENSARRDVLIYTPNENEASNLESDSLPMEILAVDRDLLEQLSSDDTPSDIESDIINNKIESGVLDDREWDEIKRCVWQLESFIELSQNGKQIFIAEREEDDGVYTLFAPVAPNLYQIHAPYRGRKDRFINSPRFRIN
jgi:hypothetical protein